MSKKNHISERKFFNKSQKLFTATSKSFYDCAAFRSLSSPSLNKLQWNARRVLLWNIRTLANRGTLSSLISFEYKNRWVNVLFVLSIRARYSAPACVIPFIPRKSILRELWFIHRYDKRIMYFEIIIK